MPQWVLDGYQEYAKRLPRDLQPRLVELNLATRSKTSNSTKAKIDEAHAIFASIGERDYVIALDVLGKSISTSGLSSKLASWQMEGHSVNILIGGPDGLDQSCLDRANEKWSLSALTLPHPLVRVVLIEQIYRAWTILQNHPYHK